MLSFLKKGAYYFIFIFIVFAVYLGFKIPLNSNEISIPEQFKKSREHTALVSQEIINLSNQIKDNLNKINELDEKKKYTDAFNLIDKTNLTIFDIRQKSVELSKELEKMIKSLEEMKAQGEEKFVIAAITNRITIITHLINYSDYLFKLNLALQKRFYGANNKEEILNLINKINDEITAINNLNIQAEEYMTEFDNSINKRL